MRGAIIPLVSALAGLASADPLGTRPSPAAYDASPVGFGPVIQMLLALALVGAGIKYALPALVKRFGGGISTPTGGTIRIEESASFPGGRLYVVEARGRTLLLGSTAQSVSCLADLTANDFAEALVQAEAPQDVLARLERAGRVKKLVLVLAVLALAAYALSQVPTIPKIDIGIGGGGAKGKEVATSLQILALLTVLSLAPAILMLTTCFTRIVIILGFVRTALGTPSLPPNQVLIGLSLFLSLFVMKPTWEQVNERAIKPLSAGTMNIEQALKAATPPVRDFMLKSTYTSDLQLFIDLRGGPKPKTKEDLDLSALVPAFIVSELKTAFLIGFYVFVPFLIIDLIVSSALMGMGMMMMPPTVISLPAKILVFVLADGWATLIQAILAGYR